MGLAGAKNKRKLGTDPNNTKWLRNTGSFGQKILRAQGWQPGENLGAKDAPHAEFHTDASASHIKVVLKEDNLGLGAKRNNGDECTGLDAFQDLLGRLNGKSDEAIEGERKARNELKLSLYVERKVGTIRFVSGGLLVGDEMTKKDEVADQETSQNGAVPSSDTSKSSEGKEEPKKKSKKRKAEAEDATGVDSEGEESKKSKKRRKGKDGGLNSADGGLKKVRKDKKESKKSHPGVDGVQSESVAESSHDPVTSASLESKKSTNSKDKSRRKEKASADSQATEEEEKSSNKKKKRRKHNEDNTSSESTAKPNAATPTETTAVPTPATSGYSTPTQDASMRHYSRRRMIAHKQMAFADPTALAQIFMIKSQP